MSTSVLKSNRNIISRLSKKLEKAYGNNLCIVKRCEVVLKKDVDYGITFLTKVGLSPSIKVMECDNSIYFCLDLTKFKVIEVEPRSLSSSIYRGAYYNGNKELKDYLEKNNIVTDRSPIQSMKSIENSQFYEMVMSTTTDILRNCEVDVILKDKEWPRVKNDRHILPIVVWDLDDCMVGYLNDDSYSKVSSYRVDRVKVSLVTDIDFSRIVRQTDRLSELLEVNILDSRIDRVEYY